MSASTFTAQSQPFRSVAILGAGAWGTALAAVAAKGGAEVTLWAREPALVEILSKSHENAMFLPGVRLPENIRATGDLSEAMRAEALLLAVPAQHLRNFLSQWPSGPKVGTPVAICAKGIELGSGLLLSEVLAEVWPIAAPVLLSGPSFAGEVARGLPTAVTIAGADPVAARLQAMLGRVAAFRPYVTDDVTGVALGGAAKNVYAIACGMVEGAGLGENARAALLARGFAELMRLGIALGARSETLMGLSGLGDLMLTATSMSSRNFALGAKLGRGMTLEEATGEGKPLAEGAATAPALVERAARHGVELPIAKAVADVLSGKSDLGTAAERLLSRPMRAE
jgi:glycerol-3-phosphate dehydrogenase (NAD(P)+)